MGVEFDPFIFAIDSCRFDVSVSGACQEPDTLMAILLIVIYSMESIAFSSHAIILAKLVHRLPEGQTGLTHNPQTLVL